MAKETKEEIAERALALQEELKALEELGASEEKQLKVRLKIAEANEAFHRSQGTYIDGMEVLDNATREATDALKDFNETQTAAKKSQDDFSNALGRTIKTFTGVTDASNTLVGSFFKLTQTQEGTEEAAELMMKTFKKTFSALNVGVSIARKMMEKTFEMAKANDQATAAFNRSTGAAGAYDKELISLQQSNMANGISAAEMGESYGALMGNLSGFGVMVESERMRLGELGAQFAKVGVSGADFAGTLETMTRGFGMSTNAATGMQEEAMELAQTLGKDVGTVMSEMNAALPKLSSYGDDAVDMFFDLEKQAQRTGIAVGDLIGIAGQYRTFDSAAEAAGNLNAVLGTQLFSTMGLLESQLEGPEAVIEYMSGTLSDSIGDWDSLNTFQKEAVANAAGMNMEQMNHLMNQKNMTAEDRERQASLDESMKAGRDLWEEMTLFAKQFAMEVQPLVEFLTKGFQGVNAVLQAMRDNFFSLGEIIAFAFATTSIFKFISAMRAMKEVQKQINDQKKRGAILSALSAAWTNPLQAVASMALAGVAMASVKGMMPKGHAKGTDSTSGEAVWVGEEGPELIIPPENSAVVNNTSMTALAEAATNRSVAGQGSNSEMAASIASLKDAIKEMSNRPIEVTTNPVMLKDDLGRGVNDHFGEPGSRPIRLRTA